MVQTQSDKDLEQQQSSKLLDMDPKSIQQENCSPLKATNTLHTYKINT